MVGFDFATAAEPGGVNEGVGEVEEGSDFFGVVVSVCRTDREIVEGQVDSLLGKVDGIEWAHNISSFSALNEKIEDL